MEFHKRTAAQPQQSPIGSTLSGKCIEHIYACCTSVWLLVSLSLFVCVCVCAACVWRYENVSVVVIIISLPKIWKQKSVEDNHRMLRMVGGGGESIETLENKPVLC